MGHKIKEKLNKFVDSTLQATPLMIIILALGITAISVFFIATHYRDDRLVYLDKPNTIYNIIPKDKKVTKVIIYDNNDKEIETYENPSKVTVISSVVTVYGEDGTTKSYVNTKMKIEYEDEKDDSKESGSYVVI